MTLLIAGYQFDRESNYSAALAAMVPPQQTMFDFLCASIDAVVARGDKGIARPAIGKTLESMRLATTLRG